MNECDKRQLRERLLHLERQQQLLDFGGEYHLEICPVTDPGKFFRNLHFLMEPGSVLYFEGTDIAAQAANLYTRHRFSEPAVILPEILFPTPEAYHVAFSSEVVSELMELVNRRQVSDLFHHLKGYTSGLLLFSFHDAFEGTLWVSERIPAAAVSGFCHALQASCFRVRTPRQNRKVLLAFLKAIENPETFRLRKAPFWKRLWATKSLRSRRTTKPGI